MILSFTRLGVSRTMSSVPRVFVFDLDGCCWDPEMYEIWGGGAPFSENKDGSLSDRNRGKYFVRKLLLGLFCSTSQDLLILLHNFVKISKKKFDLIANL